MYSLCQIVLFLLLGLSFLWGHAGELSLTAGYDRGVSTNQEDSFSQSKQNRKTLTLAGKGELSNNFTLSHSLTQSENDYSQIEVIDKSGKKESLQERLKGKQTEYFLDVGVTYQKEMTSISINGFTHLDREKSPYYRRGAKVTATQSFFENHTLIGAEWMYFEQDNPEDIFYYPLSFRSALRPRKITANRQNLFWEQDFSAVLRGRVDVFRGERKKERVPHYGAKVQGRYAWTDQFYSSMGLTHIQEDTNKELFNERGYFRLSRFQTGILWEPTFDFFLAASYALTLEKEKDPRNLREVQVATDTYAFNITFPVNEFEVGLDWAFSRDNSGQETQQLSGGMRWVF